MRLKSKLKVFSMNSVVLPIQEIDKTLFLKQEKKNEKIPYIKKADVERNCVS